ncbi:MAG: lysophospholipid acyltransferase family protein [Gemmatimonadota bacterium]
MRTPAREVSWTSGQWVRKWLLTLLSFDMHLRIAALRGWLHCALRGVPNHVRVNIQTAFPERDLSDIDRIARSSCEHSKRVYLSRVLPGLPGSNLPKKWPVVGLAHLDAALERGRGVLLITAHFGYGHIIPNALAVHGYEVARVLAELRRPEARESLEAWLARGSIFRRRFYARIRRLAEPLGPDDMVANLDIRPIIERLSRNGIVMTTGDGLRSSQFSNLPLLGSMYPFPNGFMKIAMLTDASVLPTYAVQDGRAGRIRVEIHPALPVDPQLDVEENLRLIGESLEEQVRQRPHLWTRWIIPNWFQVAREWSRDDGKDRYKTELKQRVSELR